MITNHREQRSLWFLEGCAVVVWAERNAAKLIGWNLWKQQLL